MQQPKRWRVGPFAKGAYSRTGGHIKILGMIYAWTHCQDRFSQIFEFSLFGLLACKWFNRRFQWALCGVSIAFKQARWRYGLREKRKERRAHLKKLNKMLADSRV
jgi:hypothetical protein